MGNETVTYDHKIGESVIAMNDADDYDNGDRTAYSIGLIIGLHPDREYGKYCVEWMDETQPFYYTAEQIQIFKTHVKEIMEGKRDPNTYPMDDDR